MEVASLRVRLLGDSKSLSNTLRGSSREIVSFAKAADGMTLVDFEGDASDLQSTQRGALKELSAFERAAGTSSQVSFEGDATDLRSTTQAATKEVSTFQRLASKMGLVRITGDSDDLRSETRASTQNMTNFQRAAGKQGTVRITGESDDLRSETRSATQNMTNFQRAAGRQGLVRITGDASDLQSETRAATTTVANFSRAAGQQGTVRLTADSSDVLAETRAATGAITDWKTNADMIGNVTLSADASGVRAGVNEATSAMQGFSGSAVAASGALGALVGGGVGLFAAGGAAKEFGMSILSMSSNMEQSRIAFGTMLGSAEKADSFLRELGEFAETTPFEFPELIEASKRLLAFGFAAEEIIPVLTDIGNTAAALGGGAEPMQRMIYALGQMQARTKVMNEELLQMVELGVPVFDILAKKLGVSSSEVQDLASEGKIATEVFREAFHEFATTQYGDMMARQAKTAAGAWSTIKDAIQLTMVSALRPAFTVLTGVARLVASIVSGTGLGQFFLSAAAGAQKAATYIAAFLATIGDVVTGGRVAKESLGQFSSGIQGVIRSIAGAITSTSRFVGNLVSIGRYVGSTLVQGDRLNDWLGHIPKSMRPAASSLGYGAEQIHRLGYHLIQSAKHGTKFNSQTEYMSPTMERFANRLGGATVKAREFAIEMAGRGHQAISGFAAEAVRGGATALTFAKYLGHVAVSNHRINTSLRDVPSGLQNLAANMGAAVLVAKDFTGAMIDAGRGVVVGFAKGVWEGGGPLRTMVAQMFTTAFDGAFTSLWASMSAGATRAYEQARQIAMGMDRGFVEGITADANRWGVILVQVMTRAVADLMSYLGIASPSTRMIEIGKMLVLGAIKGLVTMRGAMIAAALGLGALLVTSFFSGADPSKIQGGAVSFGPVIDAQSGEVISKGGEMGAATLNEAIKMAEAEAGAQAPGFGANVSSIFSGAMSGLAGAGTGILDILGLDKVAQAFGSIRSTVSSAATSIWNAIKAPFQGIAQTVTGTFAMISAMMGPALGNLKASFSAILPFLRVLAAFLSGVLQGAIESVVPILGIAFVAAVNVAALAIRGIAEALGWMGRALEPHIPLIQTLGRILGWVFGTLVLGVIGKGVQAIATFFSMLGKGANGVKAIAVMFDDWGRGVVYASNWMLRLGETIGRIPGLGALIRRFGETVGGVLGNVGSVFSGLARAGEFVFGVLGKVFGRLVASIRATPFGQTISNMFTRGLDAAKDFGSGLLNVFRTAFPEAFNFLRETFRKGLDFALSLFRTTSIGKYVREQVEQFRTAWATAPQIVRDAFGIVGSIIRGAFNAAKGVVSWGIGGIISTIKSAGSAVWNAFKGLFSRGGESGAGGQQTLPGLEPEKMRQAGWNVIKGFIGGIMEAGAGVPGALVRLAAMALAAFSGWLGIASPSTKFAGVGRMVIAGFIMGIQALATNVPSLLLQMGARMLLAVRGLGARIGATLRTSLAAVLPTLAAPLQTLVTGFVRNFMIIRSTVQRVMSGIRMMIQGGMNIIVGIFTLNFGKIRQGVAQWGTGFRAVIRAVLTGAMAIVRNIMGTWLTYLRQTFAQFTQTARQNMQIIKTTITAAWNVIKATTTQVFNGLKVFFGGIWTAIKGIFSGNLGQIKAGLTQAWNAAKQITESVFNGIKAFLGVLWAGLKALFANTLRDILQNVTSAWDALKKVTGATFDTVRDWITEKINAAKTNLTNSVREAKDNALRAWNELKDKVGPIFESIKNSIVDPIRAAGSTLKDVWNGILDMIAKVLDAVKLGPLADTVRGAKMASGGTVDRSGARNQRGTRMMHSGGVISQAATGGIADGSTPHAVFGEVNKKEYFIVPERHDNVPLLHGAAKDMGYSLVPERKTRPVNSLPANVLHSPEYYAAGGMWTPGVGGVADEMTDKFGLTPSTYAGHGRLGRADLSIDFVMPSGWGVDATGSSKALGDRAAQHMVDNWKRFSTEYLIWYRQMKEGLDSPWFTYQGGGGYAAPVTPSDWHTDHLHYSSTAQWQGAEGLTGTGYGAGGGFSIPNPVQLLFEKMWKPIEAVANNFEKDMQSGMVLRAGVGKLGKNMERGMYEKIDGMIPDTIGGSGGGPGTNFTGGGDSAKNRKLGEEMNAAAGWRMHWNALDKLWTKESGWNHLADNPTSDAYGIPQAMTSAHNMPAGYGPPGGDPVVQIDWGLGYIAGRHGTPSAAWQHSVDMGWYAKGGVTRRGAAGGNQKLAMERPVQNAFLKVANTLRSLAMNPTISGIAAGDGGGVGTGRHPIAITNEAGPEAIVPLNRHTRQGRAALDVANRAYGIEAMATGGTLGWGIPNRFEDGSEAVGFNINSKYDDLIVQSIAAWDKLGVIGFRNGPSYGKAVNVYDAWLGSGILGRSYSDGRIALNTTLLDKYPSNRILSTISHEIGHIADIAHQGTGLMSTPSYEGRPSLPGATERRLLESIYGIPPGGYEKHDPPKSGGGAPTAGGTGGSGSGSGSWMRQNVTSSGGGSSWSVQTSHNGQVTQSSGGGFAAAAGGGAGGAGGSGGSGGKGAGGPAGAGGKKYSGTYAVGGTSGFTGSPGASRASGAQNPAVGGRPVGGTSGGANAGANAGANVNIQNMLKEMQRRMEAAERMRIRESQMLRRQMERMPKEIGENVREATISNITNGKRHRKALGKANERINELKRSAGTPLN